MRLSYTIKVTALMVIAIIINIVFGHLVQNVFQWPIFLDSIGTILVGALLGPLGGAATGALSNVVWGAWFGSHTALPYAITSAFIGWAAGYAVSRGAFARLSSVIVTGFLIGVGAALISAPITAYVFGGITGAGNDYLNAYLTAAGSNVLQAATIQGFISDPVDKIISVVIAWLLWKPLSAHFLPPSRRGTRPFESLQGYSVGVAVSLLALLLSFVFLPAFGSSIFSIFYLAVLITAWRGGLLPALITTAVGAAANLALLVSPYYNVGISFEDWLRVSIFVIVSLAIAAIANRLERTNRELHTSLQAERESRARIKAITDGVNDALVLIAQDGRYMDVNRRFRELFGVPEGRIIGQKLEDSKTMFDQVFTESDALFERTLTSAVDQENTYQQLVFQNWPQARELQLYSTPIHDQVGYLGRLFVFRDVTHEREVDRMKTEFVSLVSHELRTPLTSIKGFTEMVLDGDAGEINEEVSEFLTIVYNNAERLVALVNDLLDLSRIESGRIQLHLERVDLNSVVETVKATMQQKLKEKYQSLTLHIDPAAIHVIGDKDKLVQVLTNYVSNAYKYTQPEGKIQIQIDKQDNYAHVAVSDNGHGIEPADQEKLFSRFYRVDNAMTREVGGTGLGLSIVKQIIELQGGEVGVQSALGKGSTFFFTVPLADSEESKDLIPEEPDLAEEDRHISGSILVVEDDPDVARLIEHHLLKSGYDVHCVHNATDALAFLDNHQPDLITLDIDLPDTSGDALAMQLHASPRSQNIPILVLSVLYDDPASFKIGAYALPKPIDQEELLATVARMLKEAARGPVLVIDDDPDIRNYLQSALEKRGLEVKTAVDGENALAQIATSRPALVLLDLFMPGIDGFAVLRSLKEDPALADIPVIAMSGSPEFSGRSRARVLALGAADFIAKPFDIELLVHEIRLFLASTDKR